MAYDAFISYSHAADGKLAPAVQTGLQRLARPWYRRWALRVFRDDTGLAVSPHLWASIATAMEDSSYFVLMASPESAASPWVNREIEHWCAHKSPDHILPVLTHGALAWDASRGDYDRAASTALPPALIGRFADEPRHLDLRWARDETELDLRHSRFREAIADLAAPMHGVAKEELESEDVRRHRRALALARTGVVSLLVFALAAVLASVFAVGNADRANAAAGRARLEAARATSAATRERRAKEAEASAAEAARRAGARATVEATNAAHQRDLAQAANMSAQQEAANARTAEGSRAAEADRARREAARAAVAADKAALAAHAAAASADEAARQRDAASTAATEADRQRAAAVQQAAVSLSRSLAANARNAINDGHLDLALLLGVEANRATSNAQARGSLLAALNQPLRGVVRGVGFHFGATAAQSNGGDVVAVVDNAVVRIITLASGSSHELRAATLGEAFSAIVFSHDGRRLATGTTVGTLNVWDVASGSVLASHLGAHPGPVHQLAFSSDGRVVSSSGFDGVKVWDVASGSLLRSFTPPPGSAASQLTFSPDGSKLASASLQLGAPVLVWDVAAGTPNATALAIGGSEVIAGVRFGADGRTLKAVTVNNGAEWSISTWDVPSGTMLGPSPPVSMPAGQRVAAVDPDLRDVIVRGGGEVNVRDAVTGERHLGPVHAPEEILGGGATSACQCPVSVSPDGASAAVSSIDGTVQVVDLARTESRLATRRPIQAVTGAKVVGLAPDGTTLALAAPDGSVTLAEVASGRRLAHQPSVRIDPNTKPAFSPRSQLLAVVAADGPIVTVDVASGQPVGPPISPPPHCARGWGIVSLSPDQRTLAAICSPRGTSDSSIWLWDVRDGSHRVWQPAPSGSFGALMVFTSDGRTLAVAGSNHLIDPTLELWDVESARLIQHFQPRVTIAALAVEPDGTMLATGHTDGSISLWTTASTQPRVQFADHIGEVTALAFTADGSTLASGGVDGLIRLWDTRSEQSFDAALTAHAGTIDFLAFHPDGLGLASSGAVSASDVIEWNVDLTSWAAQACATANRNLTQQEWRLYFGVTLAYRKTCENAE